MWIPAPLLGGLKLFLVQKYIAGVLFVLRYEHFFSSSTLGFFGPVYFPYITPFNTVYFFFLLLKLSLGV